MLTKTNKWAALLSGAGLTALAVNFFIRPEQAFHRLGFVLGAAIAVIGLVQLASFFSGRHKAEQEADRRAKVSWLTVVTGGATLAAGVALITNTNLLIVAMQTLFALWALFLGMIKIVVSIQYKLDEEPAWGMELALGLLSAALSAVLFLSGSKGMFFSAVITGIYLSVYSIYCYADFGIQLVREWKERHQK